MSTKRVAKPTKGRLTVKRGQFGSSVFVLYGEDGFPIAQTISNSSPEGMERARRGEHEANANRLASCWNAHDELLQALIALYAVARVDNDKDYAAITNAAAVIAAATGEA